jgi:hypothetical protein
MLFKIIQQMTVMQFQQYHLKLFLVIYYEAPTLTKTQTSNTTLIQTIFKTGKILKKCELLNVTIHGDILRKILNSTKYLF